MRRCRKRGKEGWDDRESGGDRRARTPVTLTARYLKVFLSRFGSYTVCPAWCERNRTMSPSLWGAEFFSRSPDITRRRLGFACGRHHAMLAAGDSGRLPISYPEPSRDASLPHFSDPLAPNPSSFFLSEDLRSRRLFLTETNGREQASSKQLCKHTRQ